MTKYTTNKTKRYREADKFDFTISLTANITVLGYLSAKIAASIFDEQTNADKFEYSYTTTGTGTYAKDIDVQIEYKYEQEGIVIINHLFPIFQKYQA